jgi:hypothetical protein
VILTSTLSWRFCLYNAGGSCEQREDLSLASAANQKPFVPHKFSGESRRLILQKFWCQLETPSHFSIPAKQVSKQYTHTKDTNQTVRFRPIISSHRHQEQLQSLIAVTEVLVQIVVQPIFLESIKSHNTHSTAD